ncbi:MAG: radical SAM protein [Nanoarchaeota archaeon]|nr:radical SAM protein [Nanoarchaeota archaeon]MBU1270285.1 radical SAM protein [Nanoarchaeota archaeon]MBU1605178.1 radical SAM protein [Nanoarchaeota archaeon]MBU2442536.1 radical SAM protein [Nanoarchaeota archaeon]
MQAFIADVVVAGSVDFSEKLYTKIYFSGCDFKCPYCNTPELLETKLEHEKDLKEIKKNLVETVGIVNGIFLTGGEPCFQKQAALEILLKAKELNLKKVIDTNGSKPEVIETMLKKELLDVVIMDVKAPFNELFEKTTKSATFFKPAQEIIKETKQTLEILKAYDEKVEIIFRTTIVPGLVFRKEDLLKIGEEIEGINSVWELQSFKNSTTIDKKMKDINSPTQQFLENLKEYLQKKLPRINIQVIN